MALISSRSNPAIKRIRSLRSRKGRDETGLFVVEGIRLVGEAMEAPAGIEQLVVAPDLLTSTFGRQIVERALAAGIPVLEVTAEVFVSISSKEGPRGISAVARQRWTPLDQARAAGLGWVALDAVQDPGNLGTVLRTADAVGAEGVILLGHSADPYDPSAVRASMGAIFSQRVVRTDFASLLDWARHEDVYLAGTSDAAATDLRAATYRFPMVLLMGSEQHGLSAAQQAACNVVVRIPMVGRSDSLNLAVATGVVLYELFYRRAGSISET